MSGVDGRKATIYVLSSRNIDDFCRSFLQRHDAGSLNSSSCKTRAYLVYIANIMAADVLATQGARASAAMI